VLASKSGGSHNDLRSTPNSAFHVSAQGQVPCICSRYDPRPLTGRAGASGSGPSTGEAMVSTAVGTSTLRRPSSTRDRQQQELRFALPAGKTGSSHHPRIGRREGKGAITVRLIHPRPTDRSTATSPLEPAPTQRKSNPRSFRNFLKRCRRVFVMRVPPSLTHFSVLCPPSCISDEDIVA
jgi:hypothetical protein